LSDTRKNSDVNTSNERQDGADQAGKEGIRTYPRESIGLAHFRSSEQCASTVAVEQNGLEK